jgi:hypothetical protein
MADEPNTQETTDTNVTVTLMHITVTGKSGTVVAEVAAHLRNLLIDTNGVVVRPHEGRGAGD